MKSKLSFLFTLFFFLLISNDSFTQIKERERPSEWKQLVKGARFMDRFLPMPSGKLSSDTWGAKNVLPRYVDNGIEDSIRSYWGGNIMLGDDNKYHLFDINSSILSRVVVAQILDNNDNLDIIEYKNLIDSLSEKVLTEEFNKLNGLQ